MVSNCQIIWVGFAKIYLSIQPHNVDLGEQLFFRNAKNSLVRVKYSGSHWLPAPSLVDVVVFVKHIILENDEKSRSVSFGLLPNILNL